MSDIPVEFLIELKMKIDGELKKAIGEDIFKKVFEKEKWIPVTEKLPEAGKETRVLATIRHKDPTHKGVMVDEVYYEARVEPYKFCINYPGSENLYVTAWMPFPRPYEAKKEETK